MIRVEVGSIRVGVESPTVIVRRDGKYNSPSVLITGYVRGNLPDIEAVVEDYRRIMEEEEHQQDSPCWCIRCRIGAGTLLLDTTTHTRNGEVIGEAVTYSYYTGSGHGLYWVEITQWRGGRAGYEGSLRSLASGGEYARLLGVPSLLWEVGERLEEGGEVDISSEIVSLGEVK